MIEFVPLELYYSVYIYAMFTIIIFMVSHWIILPLSNNRNIIYTNLLGYSIFLVILVYLGLRPISGYYFGDTSTYAAHFAHYSMGGELIAEKDKLFHMFMKACSSFMNVYIFFTICMLIYLIPLYKVSKSLFRNFWFYAFFMFVISLSFYPYGVNGIRNGIATSLFLLGISYHKHSWIRNLWFLVAILIHKTLLLPVICFLFATQYSNVKKITFLWLLCIPMSLVMGGFWESLFASFGFADERLTGYLVTQPGERYDKGGFRWDFILYSSVPIIMGYYFIMIKKMQDSYYSKIYITYVLANAFWILVIRANFSNRFAYLSWFLMPLIIIYPFLKKEFFSKQHLLIGKVMSFYFAFTYIMYLLND